MRAHPRSDLIDLVGKKFGRYTVLEYAGCKNWKVQCECGSPPKIVQGGTLRGGYIVSCGCYHREATRARTFKHGASINGPTPEYRSWTHMHQRCSNPSSHEWMNYGGRGISVCARWSGPNGFANFLADMGPRPSLMHTIERRDNNGNYEPGNCYWATRKQQQLNRRVNHRFTVNGVTKTVTEWAEAAGITNSTAIINRIRRGWSIEDACLTPPMFTGGYALKAKREGNKQ